MKMLKIKFNNHGEISHADLKIMWFHSIISSATTIRALITVAWVLNSFGRFIRTLRLVIDHFKNTQNIGPLNENLQSHGERLVILLVTSMSRFTIYLDPDKGW